MEKQPYIICQTTDFSDLEPKVNELIAQGYQPIGGVVDLRIRYQAPMNDRYVYAQTMVLVDTIEITGSCELAMCPLQSDDHITIT